MEPPDLTSIISTFRVARLLLRLTMEQLAEKVDKSSNFIGQIERGESKPSLETLVSIANALGTTVDSLLRDNLNKDNDNIIREIETLLYPENEHCKNFILDVVKRYIFHNGSGE